VAAAYASYDTLLGRVRSGNKHPSLERREPAQLAARAIKAKQIAEARQLVAVLEAELAAL
jgi:hypothetical protein